MAPITLQARSVGFAVGFLYATGWILLYLTGT